MSGGSISPGSLVPGIVLALTAALCNSSAIALQASEARREAPQRGASLVRRLLHRRRWVAGTALMVGAFPLQASALALAPITIVQPMLSTSLLILLAISAVKLRERVGWHEVVGALAIVLGLAIIVAVAPRHALAQHSSLRLFLPLAGLGGLVVLCQMVGRLHPRTSLLVVLAAGGSYAWSDFANKLLALNASDAAWAAAGGWLAGSVGFGGIAFLSENAALQRRAATSVAPLIAAIKVPVPVLLALFAGTEGFGPADGVPIVLGLLCVAGGAGLLARSGSIGALTRQDEDAPQPQAQAPRASTAPAPNVSG